MSTVSCTFQHILFDFPSHALAHSSYHQQDQEISVEGATLRAIRTPGHTDDHMCFALVEEQAIFCGDTVLGQGTCVFRNLKTYMASLGALIAAKPQRMFPGHGPVIEQGVPFVQAYVEHRMKRERQIVEALGDGGGARTAMELVKLLYSDVRTEFVYFSNRNMCAQCRVPTSGFSICDSLLSHTLHCHPRCPRTRLGSTCTALPRAMFCFIWASCGKSAASRPRKTERCDHANSSLHHHHRVANPPH